MGLPQELERLMTPELREQLKHSVSHCTLEGRRLLVNPMQTEDLFEVIAGMVRFIVDTNSNWKAESRAPENKGVAFILGKTVTMEEDNLKSLYFSQKVDISNNNLFHLGLEELGGNTLVVLERLDKPYALIFDQRKLVEESMPRAQRTDPEFQSRQRRQLLAVDEERRCILDLLHVKRIGDLPLRNKIEAVEAEILEFVRDRAPLCRYDWWRSVEVARRCYALLLIQKGGIRTEFADPAYRHVFGDVTLVQNALFLRAGILSNDHAPKRMAGYTGLRELVCRGSVQSAISR